MIRRWLIAASAALALTGCGETAMRTYESEPEPQDWTPAPGESRIGGAALRSTFLGNVVTYDDGSVTSFYKDGGYARTSGAETATGTYRIAADGVVCLQPDAGMRDCAIYVDRDDTMVRRDQAGGASAVTAIDAI
jgi:hypothetical protein